MRFLLSKRTFYSVSVLTLLVTLSASSTTYASYDTQCVANGIANYGKAVLDALGTVPTNVRLLSPTFNMSEPQFKELYAAYVAEAKKLGVWGSLYAVSGNAYNTDGQYNVQDWIQKVNEAGGLGDKKLVIPETGRGPSGTNPLPTNLISTVYNGTKNPNITLDSANLFNAFNTNPQFVHGILNDDEIKQVCGSNCSNLGVNFAGSFPGAGSEHYTRAANLGLGFMVGIVGSVGDVGGLSAVLSNNFTPIVRIGSGSCASSGAGEFGGSNGAKNYADFIRLSAEAAGGRIIYFILGPNEPDVEQWWASDYGSGGSCGCSSTNSDVNPGSKTCVPSKYGLTIKGNIKSSRPGYLVPDPLTGKIKPTPINLLPTSLGNLGNPVTNQTVRGAFVAIYASQQLEGFKYASSGKVDGNITNLLSYAQSDREGNFEISTSNICTEVYDRGYKQYLAVFCPDSPDGVDYKMVMKDLYGFRLNIPIGGGDDSVVTLKPFNVDCEYNLEEMSAGFAPPADLEYVVRNKEEFLACSGNQNTASMPDTESVGFRWNFKQEFRDVFGKEGDLEDVNKSWWERFVLAVMPFRGRTEGRMQFQNMACSPSDQWSNTTAFYGGIKGDYVDLTKYFVKGVTSGVATYNGYEQKPNLYDCEDLRRCNMPVTGLTGEELDAYDSMKNSQTCGGPAFTQATPYDCLRVDGTLNPEGMCARFLQTSKDQVVCVDSTGSNHKFKEFLPPPQFCGDLDKSGDINGNEVDCSQKAQFTYPDSDYFPYFAMFTPSSDLQVPAVDSRTSDDSDYPIISNQRREDYLAGTPGGKNKPDNGSDPHSGETAARAFRSTTYVKMGLAQHDTNFNVTKNLISNIYTEQNSPVLNIATPQFGQTPEENLKRAVSEIKLDDRAGFFKIGLLENLCGCTLVESGGSKRLENCLTAGGDSAPPRAVEPANTFTAFSDENLDEGEDWLEFNDPEKNTQLTLERSQGPSTTAGGFDYEQAEKGRGKEGAGEPGTFYGEQFTGIIDTIGRLLKTPSEIVQCAVSLFDQTPDVLNDGKVDCGRRLYLTSDNSSAAPWFPKNDQTAATLFGLLLNQPYEATTQVQNVCEWNMEKTKAADPEGLEGNAFEVATGTSAVPYTNYATSAVASPDLGSLEDESKGYACWKDAKVQGFPGLMTVSCSSGSNCHALGGIKNQAWTAGTAFDSFTTDAGLTWTANDKGGPAFILGSHIRGPNGYAVGRGSNVYKIMGNDISYIAQLPYTQRSINPIPQPDGTVKYEPSPRAGLAYDVEIGSKGMLATGTGHAFYSSDGKTWAAITSPDCNSYSTPDNPPACQYSPFSKTPCCDDQGGTPNPDCPRRSCWQWGAGALWGVDCDAGGNCMIVGNGSGVFVNRAGEEATDASVWWGNRTSTGAFCTGGTGKCGALDVAVMSSKYALVVGGMVGAGDAGVNKGGYIAQSLDNGATWKKVYPTPQNTTQSPPAIMSIDCTVSGDCVAAGNEGFIIHSSDYGATWQTPQQIIKGQKPVANNIEFWGVYHGSKNTAYAVGYTKPDFKGVIYNFKTNWGCGQGDWSECLTEDPGVSGSCSGSPSTKVCEGTGDQCKGGKTVEWNESNTRGTGPKSFYSGKGVTKLVNIKGTYKFRDPMTTRAFLAGQASNAGIYNGCRAKTSSVENFPGSIMMYVDYNGEISEFRLESQCNPVGEIDLNLWVPENSSVAVTSHSDNYHSGTGGNCEGKYPVQYFRAKTFEDKGVCGYSWAEVTRINESVVTSCGYKEQCSVSSDTDPNNHDYTKGVGKCVEGDLGCSGTCFADEFGYTYGGVPCGSGVNPPIDKL